MYLDSLIACVQSLGGFVFPDPLIMNLWMTSALTWLLFGMCSSTPGLAAERLALLIGNSAYTANVGPLRNPHNDVDLLSASLLRIGFKVRVVKDAGYRKMDVAIRRYAARLRRAGPGAVGFFYYSGHGLANPETNVNYLIPIDVEDVRTEDVWFHSFEQNSLIERLNRRASQATHYVVFDACRNELQIASPGKKSLGSPKGFVPVANTPGLLIAYSTAPGKTASDVGDGGGPYATVLAQELVRPGVEAVAMFRNVQVEVKRRIQQDPWLSFPSLPEIYLAGREPIAGKQIAPDGKGRPTMGQGDPGPRPPMSLAARAWMVTKDTTSRAVLKSFIDEFPRSVYAKLALARLKELRGNSKEPENSLLDNNSDNGQKLALKLQLELKRVGCYANSVDGDWGPGSKLAMTLFNKHNKSTFRKDSPTPAAIKAVSQIYTRVCPLGQALPVQPNKGASPSQTTPNIARNCRKETRQECKYRVCPQGSGCGLRGTRICQYSNRKTICQ